jgi:hypothetical protein
MKRYLLTFALFVLLLSPVTFAQSECASGGSFIDSNNQKVQEVVSQIVTYPKTPEYCWKNAETVYYWVANNIVYKDDESVWGKEYWQTPQQTIELKSGDCEDQAFLLASLLIASGCPAENVRVVIGKILGGGGHAWVELYTSVAKEQYLYPLSIFPVQERDFNLTFYFNEPNSKITINTKDLREGGTPLCIIPSACSPKKVKEFNTEPHWVVLDTAILTELDRVLPPTLWEYLKFPVTERDNCFMQKSEEVTQETLPAGSFTSTTTLSTPLVPSTTYYSLTTTTLPTDKTKLTQVLTLLEGLKARFEQLKTTVHSIVDYYSTAGNTAKATCWEEVSMMLEANTFKIDNIEAEIDVIKNNPTQADLEEVKSMVRGLRNNVDKTIDQIFQCVTPSITTTLPSGWPLSPTTTLPSRPTTTSTTIATITLPPGGFSSTTTLT